MPVSILLLFRDDVDVEEYTIVCEYYINIISHSSPSGGDRDIEENNQRDGGHDTGNRRMRREGATETDLPVVPRGIRRHHYGGPRVRLENANTPT